MKWLVVVWLALPGNVKPEFVGAIDSGERTKIACEFRADYIRSEFHYRFPNVPLIVACVSGGEVSLVAPEVR